MTLAENLSRAEALLKEVGTAPILNHIGGVAVPAASGRTFGDGIPGRHAPDH